MKVKKLHGRGNHLIVDGHSNAQINSVNFVKNFLVKFVDLIGMKAISKPFVIEYNPDGLEGGITGTIILAESNITIHTYPKKNFIFLDIFSCKEFDIKKVLEELVDVLKLEDYKNKILVREFYG